MPIFISLLRVRDALMHLQDWKSRVDSQGCKHLLHFLAAKRGGVNSIAWAPYQEAKDYEFCNIALRVRPGKEPYYDPLDGEFRIESHPHSNIATARKKTFRDAWKAALTRDTDEVEHWKFQDNYLAILCDKVISKGGRTTRIPVYDLCAWLYRRHSFPDTATLGDVTALFFQEYHIEEPEKEALFSQTQIDGLPEEQKRFFTKQPASDAMMLEMLKDPTSYDLADSIELACKTTNRHAVTDEDIANLLLRGNKQVALQGPPGTGKTHLAKRTASRILGTLDQPAAFESLFINLNLPITASVQLCEAHGGWSLVQFHPSYAYEDFVRGLAPCTNQDGTPGFTIQDRTFSIMCTIARKIRPKPVILVIDEINRGDLSKVLGELIYALEYRDSAASLQYSKPNEEPFCVPSNMLVIATLNTADRSISHVDYAIRRRFSFVSLRPDRSVVERMHEHSLIRDGALALFDCVSNLFTSNPEIAVGHSYFLAQTPEALAKDVVFQVLPLLAEYRADGLLGDTDSISLPNWPGRTGLPLFHTRPFDLSDSLASWLETYIAPHEQQPTED